MGRGVNTGLSFFSVKGNVTGPPFWFKTQCTFLREINTDSDSNPLWLGYLELCEISYYVLFLSPIFCFHKVKYDCEIIFRVISSFFVIIVVNWKKTTSFFPLYILLFKFSIENVLQKLMHWICVYLCSFFRFSNSTFYLVLIFKLILTVDVAYLLVLKFLK